MAEASAPRPTAAVLLIGNELLSGKIRDENGWYLSRVCRRRGLTLREIAVVPDELDTIGEALLRLLTSVPLVFTSGGVGPTHDDVTMAAIARATGRRLIRDGQMEAILRQHYKGAAAEAALRMAEIPEGTTLRALPGWPVMRLDLAAGEIFGARPPQPHDARIYILPGIPALLRAKIETLEGIPGELPPARDWALVELHTSLDESALADRLDEVVADFADVEIGSYPSWIPDEGGRLRVRVKITFEASDAARAQAARDALADQLDPARLLPPPAPTS
ncbi:competence/damage-inducible protein A [Pseudenhygromyxa sp. WMMC2535]|uniref:competence/damage-inducible protein A n=1 Tax=Pseudenhygromyxa sp. WMMC2535 TaxID=2712867 RepID=UPI0015559AAD|nr:molybdopterin-binding protein [Pseudenhygromyxa sp. WMMC2535]NVB41174.1 competence/damage-inducible protein A [Pseudenhygromyxa sp. WMMC2535]